MNRGFDSAQVILDAGFPCDCASAEVAEPGFRGQWIDFPKAVLQSAEGARFKLENCTGWVALERYLPWWPRPVFGKAETPREAEYFLVMWEREDGAYSVALPLVDGEARGVLRGGGDGWSLRAAANDPGPDIATLLFVATGADPLALLPWAVGKIAERLQTFRLRTQKAVPKWIDYLGWCTWDAFHQEVTAEKVLEGLESFKAGGFTPRFVILDDGWQDERNSQLWSFRTHPGRFPHGLQPLVAQAREDYGVHLFGVWHTLEGYWNGVHPQGELAGQYELVPSEGIAYNMPGAASQKRSLVHPKDVGRFFDDYHRRLREQGVDMVKVDNQASLDHFCTGDVPPTATMRAYQYALQEAVQTHFHGESLHCMSHTTDAVLHLKSAAVWRSSQDFFPLAPETQGLHIFDNAINSLWVQTFAVPDWDMFQTTHPAAGFHAAARAISGGPIYVSDKPDSHDFGLLAKLMVSEGRVLRCRQPAVPARDSLFRDGRALPLVMKIVNFNAVEGSSSPIGILGLFNCTYDKSGPVTVTGNYGASDVPGLSASRYALFHQVGGHVAVADGATRLPISLDNLGYELVTVSPIENGVALFGLIDKFNGSRALESVRWISTDMLELVTVDGGRVGWYSERNGCRAIFQSTPVEVASRGPLSWVELPEGESVTLILDFA